MGYIIEEIVETYIDTSKTLTVKFRLVDDKSDQVRVIIDTEFYNWYVDNYNYSDYDSYDEDGYDEYYDYNKWDIDLYYDKEKIIQYISERYEIYDLPNPNRN